MCYEFWQSEQERAREAEARKRAREMIDKARAAGPVKPDGEPATAEQERERDTVPA